MNQNLDMGVPPEGFKAIPGVPLHVVNESGEIVMRWRNNGFHPKKQRIGGNGYMHIGVCANDRVTNMLVHRLVAYAFIGPKPFPLAQIRHLDGNRLNNHASNLRWGTAQENAADQKMHGTCPRALNGKKGAAKQVGELNSASRLTADSIHAIRLLSAGGWAVKRIGRAFQISDINVRRILSGKMWGSVQVEDPAAVAQVAEAENWDAYCKSEFGEEPAGEAENA